MTKLKRQQEMSKRINEQDRKYPRSEQFWRVSVATVRKVE